MRLSPSRPGFNSRQKHFIIDGSKIFINPEIEEFKNYNYLYHCQIHVVNHSLTRIYILMTSLYTSIYNLLSEDNKKSNAELYKIYAHSNRETVRRYAAKARKILRENESPIEVSKHISLEVIEPIIFDKITHNPSNQDLKLAVEILKLKAQESGMVDDLDINKYVKKTLSILQGKEEDDIEMIYNSTDDDQ